MHLLPPLSFGDVLAVVAWQAAAVAGFALVAFAIWFKLADGDIPAMLALRRVKPGCFKGKVVFVTGASMGIGEVLAYDCAKRGATVVVAARSMDKLLAVAEQCKKLGAPDAMAIRIDMAEPQEAHMAAVEQVIRKFGRIDYLVNNAGRSQRALAEETELAVDEELMRINFFGVISLTKCVLPHMLERGEGHILNTSSVAGKSGSPLSASYAAAKGAVQLYFNALRAEVGSRGVFVSNVCPGPIGTGTITLNAATAKAGEKFGQMQESNVQKMTTERCVDYIVAAMDQRLEEVWCSLNPVLFFTYIAQYCLGLYFLLTPIVGARRVAAFKGGDSSYGSIQSIPSILWGWVTGKDQAAAKAGRTAASAIATGSAAPEAAPPSSRKRAAKKD